MYRSVVLRLSILALFTAMPLSSAVITLDFEGFSESTFVNNLYSAQGAIFTNAQILTAAISLNEAEFPPFSGQNVALDALGPIRIDFSSLVGSFSAHFTYGSRLQLSAFNIANVQVGSASSLFASNFVSSGNSPNELLQVVYATGIHHVLITGDPAGGSFVMDNAVFNTTISTLGSPEPGTAALCLIGLLGVTAMSRRRLRW